MCEERGMSRELDQLAAEHVMGWSYQTFPDGTLPHVRHWYSKSPCPNNARDISFVGSLPYFSDNIAGAWQLVKEIQRSTEASEFKLWQDYEGLWGCTFTGNGSLTYAATIYNQDSESMAITLAALKAKGIDVSKWEETNGK